MIQIKDKILSSIEPLISSIVQVQRVDNFKDVSEISKNGLYGDILNKFGTDHDFCELLLIDEFLTLVFDRTGTAQEYFDDLTERLDDFLFDDIDKMFHVEHSKLIDAEESLAEGEFDTEKLLHDRDEARAINSDLPFNSLNEL